MKRNKSEYENDIAALIGRQLSRVRYFEIYYETANTYYTNPLFNGHILDYGCDLEMADGSIFGIIWDGEFFHYGAGISKASLSAQLPNARIWDFTEDNYWLNLIGKTITRTRVFWSDIQYTESQERHYYPQDVELKFSDGSSVFFSAFQYNEDKGILYGASDDIAIVFGNEAAQDTVLVPMSLKICSKVNFF